MFAESVALVLLLSAAAAAQTSGADNTALIGAATNGNVEFARALMTWRANVNVASADVFRKVRSSDAVISAAIRQAAEDSPTVRRLMDIIEEANGVVYIEDGVCGRGVSACLTLAVYVAGPYRYLRILLNPRHAIGCELLSTIGHELQHAVEVLQNPKIVNYHTAFRLFEQMGRTGDGRFETPAAQDVEFAVLAEVRTRKTCRTARMTQSRDARLR